MNDKAVFFRVIRQYPNISQCFDEHKSTYDQDAIDYILKMGSHGEAIMARFFIGVWKHEDILNFDFTEAASTLDDQNRAIIAQWLMSPYWP